MPGPIKLLAAVGVIGVLALAGYVMRASFRMPVRVVEPVADAEPVLPEEPGEDVVARALRLAGIDSTRKRAWVDEIPDLELAALDDAQRDLFLRIANGRECGCGCGFTLAGCRRFDTECEVSGPRALALFDSIRARQVRNAQGHPGRDTSLAGREPSGLPSHLP